MFESVADRIAGTLLMGLDVAVEFATLGEFRLVEADAAARGELEPAPLVRRPMRTQAITPDPQLLPPASTAIARAAAASTARAAARRDTPRLGELFAARSSGKAVIPSAPRRRPAAGANSSPAGAAGGMQKPAPRKRGGAVEAGTQLCLFRR